MDSGSFGNGNVISLQKMPCDDSQDCAQTVTQRPHRPSIALTMKLLVTFKDINEAYYRAKRLQKVRTSSDGKPLYNDGFDDESGNYVVQIGEEIGQRYVVREILGKGSFGIVLKAFDQRREESVALKVIRNRSHFAAQARIEVDILSTLNEAALDDDNVVRLKKYFHWKSHLCLVFELLSFNLYDLLKFTKFSGVSINLVKKFGIQMLATLKFLEMHSPQIIHCDLKPENILLRNPKRSAIKVIDFGSSCYATKRMYKYIQSRFYRSPEVILGLQYTCAIDVWSAACIFVEMHTGFPLFDGRSELEQLHKMRVLLGSLPFHLIDSAPKRDTFFSYSDGRYVLKPLEGRERAVDLTDSLEEIIVHCPSSPGSRRKDQAGHSEEDYVVFINLLRQMLQYDQAARVTAAAAMKHPFFDSVRDIKEKDTAANLNATCIPDPTKDAVAENIEAARAAQQAKFDTSETVAHGNMSIQS